MQHRKGNSYSLKSGPGTGGVERRVLLIPGALRKSLAAISLVLLLQIPAFSQGITQQPDVRPELNPIGLISESQAFWLSLSGTALPLGILLAVMPPLDSSYTQAWSVWGGTFAAVILSGPSFGYFYGGVPLRGLQGIGIRTGLLCAIFISGPESGLSYCCWAGLWISIIWDICAVGGHVRRHNIKLQGKPLAASPILYPAGKGVGVGLKIQFSF
jgi:hypothetical protein